MFEELKTIELSGKKYPIKCDLVVLEKIQEEFTSLEDFENGIYPWEPELDEKGKKIKTEDGKIMCKGKIPNIRAVNAALHFMVNEGEEIMAEKEGRTPVLLSRKEIIRKVDTNPTSIASQLHDEYYRCFRVKNSKTTQDQTSQEKEISS